MFRVKNSAMTMGYDSIRIPCRNGLEFSESNGQIVFDLGREIGMANLKNAVIEMDVNINGSANCPLLQLNRVNGGQSIIQRISIRSNGRLLEQLDNYNLYSGLHYAASHDNGVMNKRSITEGCAKSYKIQDNPFATQNEAAAAGAALNTVAQCWKYIDRKLQIPILGGIFQNEKSMPLMAIPLEVEIILEKNVRALFSNPVLTDNLACEDVPAALQSFIDLTAAECQKFGVVGGGNQFPTDTKLNMKSNLPFRVGQRVQLAKTGGAGVLTNDGKVNIASITDNAGLVRIDFGANVNTLAAAMTGMTISATNDGALFTDTAAAGGHAVVGQSVNYLVKSPRLIVPKIIPAPAFNKAMNAAIAKGSYAFDIVSYTDYLNDINGSTTSSTSIIPADLSRVKAILSVPQELQNINKLNNVNAQQGRYMGAASYEYQINNRMIPSRLVQLGREQHGAFVVGANNFITAPIYAHGSSLAAVHTYEVEKALQDSDIQVRNLKFLGKTVNQDLQDGYYLVGRTLGPYGMSENLMGVSANLYLNYDGTNTSLKLLHNYVVHIRTIQLGPSGVVLRY